MTAQMAMVMSSSNWCRLHRSILGSSNSPKHSMTDAPFPFLITPHITPKSLGLPSNDKPTIYNAIALEMEAPRYIFHSGRDNIVGI